MSLCFVKDRLYLVEREYEYESLHWGHSRTTGTSEGGSHRVLVLSLQGDILQVVTHPTEPTAVFKSIYCFDDKLLASYSYYCFDSAGTRKVYAEGMLALGRRCRT